MTRQRGRSPGERGRVVPDPSRRRAALLLAVGGVVLLAGCSGHVDPNVCGLCNDAAAAEAVDAANVTGTEMHVYLDREGDARVEITLSLGESTVETLRSNPSRYESYAGTLRRAAANPLAEVRPTPQDVFGGMGGGAPSETPRPVAPASSPDTVEVSLTDRGVVVTYRVEDFARTVGGSLVVEAFYFHDENPPADAERTTVNVSPFVIHAPDGMAVTAVTGDGTPTVDPRSVTWVGGTISPHTYVVFGPADGPLSAVRSRLAIALSNLEWAVGIALLPAGLALGLFALALLDVRRRTDPGESGARPTDGPATGEGTDSGTPDVRSSPPTGRRVTLATCVALAVVILAVASETGPARPLTAGVLLFAGASPLVGFPLYFRGRARADPEPVRYVLAAVSVGSAPVVAIGSALFFGGRASVTAAGVVVLWSFGTVLIGRLATWVWSRFFRDDDPEGPS